MNEPKVFQWIKTDCGSAKYAELSTHPEQATKA